MITGGANSETFAQHKCNNRAIGVLSDFLLFACALDGGMAAQKPNLPVLKGKNSLDRRKINFMGSRDSMDWIRQPGETANILTLKLIGA